MKKTVTIEQIKLEMKEGIIRNNGRNDVRGYHAEQLKTMYLKYFGEDELDLAVNGPNFELSESEKAVVRPLYEDRLAVCDTDTYTGEELAEWRVLDAIVHDKLHSASTPVELALKRMIGRYDKEHTQVFEKAIEAMGKYADDRAYRNAVRKS